MLMAEAFLHHSVISDSQKNAYPFLSVCNTQKPMTVGMRNLYQQKCYDSYFSFVTLDFSYNTHIKWYKR